MASPILSVQRRLGKLSPSDSEYQGLLREFLSHRGLKPYIHALQGNDLREFVELLDNALNHFPSTDDLFRKTLRRLQSACSNREVLPSSYLIPNELLSKRENPSLAGGFADVYEGEFNGQRVCIKSLRLHSLDTGDVTKRAFYREVVMWKTLHHPNIVPFLGVPTRTPPFEIVCHWMEGGRITEYVEKNQWADRIGLLRDVANGLHYLHSCEIIHGDLKVANILIDKGGHARLTDFGLTSIIRGDNSARSPQDQGMASNTMWAAPEILRGEAVSKEGDIFTFAMVTIETFTGRPPLVTSVHSAWFDIMRGERPQRPATLTHDGLWEFIQKCWDQQPANRPTTVELLEFFQTSFPGEIGVPEAQKLPIAPSTWTLVGPEAHLDRIAQSRADKSRQGTQDDPGPLDPFAWDPRVAGLEPPTLVERQSKIAAVPLLATTNASETQVVHETLEVLPETPYCCSKPWWKHWCCIKPIRPLTLPPNFEGELTVRPPAAMEDDHPGGRTSKPPAVRPDPNPAGQTREDPRINVISPSRPLTPESSSRFDVNAGIRPLSGSSTRIKVEQPPLPLPPSPNLEGGLTVRSPAIINGNQPGGEISGPPAVLPYTAQSDSLRRTDDLQAALPPQPPAPVPPTIHETPEEVPETPCCCSRLWWRCWCRKKPSPNLEAVRTPTTTVDNQLGGKNSDPSAVAPDPNPAGQIQNPQRDDRQGALPSQAPTVISSTIRETQEIKDKAPEETRGAPEVPLSKKSGWKRWCCCCY